MKLAAYWSQEALVDAVMVNAPLDEPLALSFSRLASAIRHDARHGLAGGAPRSPEDPPPVYSPLTVWFAYSRHPSLSRPFKPSRSPTTHVNAAAR